METKPRSAFVHTLAVLRAAFVAATSSSGCRNKNKNSEKSHFKTYHKKEKHILELQMVYSHSSHEKDYTKC